MLPNLLLNFTEYFQPLNIFNYISFRTIGALLTALLISFIFGEKIIFLKNGKLEWEGSKKNIFQTENEAVTDFVYSSELYKKVRKMYLKK